MLEQHDMTEFLNVFVLCLPTHGRNYIILLITELSPPVAISDSVLRVIQQDSITFK